jgi:hypothetical protein
MIAYPRVWLPIIIRVARHCTLLSYLGISRLSFSTLFCVARSSPQDPSQIHVDSWSGSSFR